MNSHSTQIQALSVLTALVLTLVGTTSYAATTTKKKASAQSVATRKAKSDFLTRTSIVHDSYFFGPAANNPVSGKTTGGMKEAKSFLSFDNYLSASYKINDNMSISPILNYTLRATTGVGASGARASMGDAYLKFKYSGLATAILAGGHKFKLDADTRYYAPTSTDSQNIGQIGAIRTSLNPSLKLANSKFSFAAVSYIKYYIQSDNTQALSRWAFYTGPQVNYALSNRVTAWFLAETANKIKSNGASYYDVDGISMTDLEPGLDIQVSDNILVTPYLNWFINQPLDTTSVNVFTSIKLL